PRREEAKPKRPLHRLRTLPRKSGLRHGRPETRPQKRRPAKPQPKERLQRNRQEKVLLQQASAARLIKKPRQGSPEPLQCHRGVEPEPAGKGQENRRQKALKDLPPRANRALANALRERQPNQVLPRLSKDRYANDPIRSEERRVGKECRHRLS